MILETKLKLIAIFLLLIIGSVQVKAQNNFNIGIGADLGLPSGNFSGLSGIGLGATIKASFPIATNYAITVGGGLMNFFGRKNQLAKVLDLTYIPLKAGLKYQLGEGFYAEGQAGIALPLNDGQQNMFVWSPGIGYIFNLSGKNKFDLGIRYEAWNGRNDSIVILNPLNTKGFIGIRFAYLFGF